MELNQAKLNEFLGKMVNDLGATVGAALILTGDKLGLYKALAADGPLNSAELAQRTGTNERYVREWLAAQAAAEYVEYNPTGNTFSMSPEQVAVFADDDSPANMTGGFYSAASVIMDEPKVANAFQTGEGISWGDHDSCLFCGVEKFFKPGYQANLASTWIPALDGVEEKLKEGCFVADIGCGYGASTMVLAEAYPNSKFFGFDFHHPSIVHARTHAEMKGLKNVRFETSTARKASGRCTDSCPRNP
jgi:2-polyprenyl-3-methyl-5-hydroxy-6-metoxy-1,4-benzoquinol methylase